MTRAVFTIIILMLLIEANYWGFCIALGVVDGDSVVDGFIGNILIVRANVKTKRINPTIII